MRTAKVDVNGIAIVLDKLSCGEEDVRVVGAELDCQRPVLRARLEHHSAIFDVSGEKACMEHWSVAQLGAISACQHPVGQLGLVHHGSHNVLRTSNAIVKFVRVVLSFDLGDLLSDLRVSSGIFSGYLGDHFLIGIVVWDCFDHC